MAIILTGGAGYIGSHTAVELLLNGYDVIIFDNFSNSSRDVPNRIESITNRKLICIEGDVRSREDLTDVFEKYKIDAVMHFAAKKSIPESIQNPLDYYNNNITGTLNLCSVMKQFGCYVIVFSSSASVYGDRVEMPVNELMVTQKPTNPYGSTKLMMEEILVDLQKSDKKWSVVILRYFNPVGAHESAQIGESPKAALGNIMPHIVRVARGEEKKLIVCGNDFNTTDGTGIRDYIHVCDLAVGHVKAIAKAFVRKGILVYNLGTGGGTSVLDLIETFEKINNVNVPYEIGEKRAGDVAICYANVTKAERELEWKATRNLEDMCSSAWKFACFENKTDK